MALLDVPCPGLHGYDVTDASVLSRVTALSLLSSVMQCKDSFGDEPQAVDFGNLAY